MEEEGAFSRKEEEEEEEGGQRRSHSQLEGRKGLHSCGEKSPGIKAKIIQLQSRESTKMKERKEYFFVVGFHKDVFLVESAAGQR